MSPFAVNATLIDLGAVIDGSQSGTGSIGTGSAVITFDDITNLLSWDISWSGLLGTVTVAHSHGPALPGFKAGVQVDFFELGPRQRVDRFNCD